MGDHEDTLTSASNAGFVLRKQDRLEEAEVYLRFGFNGYTRNLGMGNDRTATGASNLGSLLRDQHRFAEAEPLMRQVFEYRAQVLGPYHADTLSAMDDLRSIQEALSKLEQQ